MKHWKPHGSITALALSLIAACDPAALAYDPCAYDLVEEDLDVEAEVPVGLPLPREYARNSLGEVSCFVEVDLPSGLGCGEREGEHTTSMAGRGVGCYLDQLVTSREQRAAGTEPTGVGFYYDDYGAGGNEGPWLRLSDETTLDTYVAASVRCYAPPETELDVDVGTFCDDMPGACTVDDDATRALEARFGGAVDLVCLQETHTCVLGCIVDGDCPRGTVCERPSGSSSDQRLCVPREECPL